MFYRVIRYEYAPERYDEILAWAGTKTDELRAIDGLIAVDTFVANEGEGIIVATYENEAAFSAASATVTAILADMARLMSSPPVTSSGTVTWTTRP